MKKGALILDLDDTIFRTRSMKKEIFEPFFDDLGRRLKNEFSAEMVEEILERLWDTPWDRLAAKHGISKGHFTASINVLDSLDLDLRIEPFPDYQVTRALPQTKFLV